MTNGRSILLYVFIYKWSTKVLCDNRANDSYYYKVTFMTGIGSGSGTTSNVFFTLAGDDDQTSARRASDGSSKVKACVTCL